MAVVLTLACKPLYYFDMGYLEISESSGYPEDEIIENYDELISYNLSPFKDKLTFPTFPMSEEAEIHFKEVKKIFQFFLGGCVFGGPLAAGLVLWKRKRRETGYLKGAGIVTLALPVLLGVYVGLNWEEAFVLFHEIMFRNDYWLFDAATDPVITILPDTFFFHCAAMILVLIAAGAAVCFTGYFNGRRRREKHEKAL